MAQEAASGKTSTGSVFLDAVETDKKHVEGGCAGGRAGGISGDFTGGGDVFEEGNSKLESNFDELLGF